MGRRLHDIRIRSAGLRPLGDDRTRSRSPPLISPTRWRGQSGRSDCHQGRALRAAHRRRRCSGNGAPPSASFASIVLTDGYPVFPAPYSEERLTEYLLPIKPRWDGSAPGLDLVPLPRAAHVLALGSAVPRASCRHGCAGRAVSLSRDDSSCWKPCRTTGRSTRSAFRHPGLAMIDEPRPSRSASAIGRATASSRPCGSIRKRPGRAIFPRPGREAAKEELDVLQNMCAGTAAAALEQPPSAVAGTRARDYVATSLGPGLRPRRRASTARRADLLLHDLPGRGDDHARRDRGARQQPSRARLRHPRQRKLRSRHRGADVNRPVGRAGRGRARRARPRQVVILCGREPRRRSQSSWLRTKSASVRGHRVSLAARQSRGIRRVRWRRTMRPISPRMGRRQLPASLASSARPGTVVAVEPQNRCAGTADAPAHRSGRSPSPRDRACCASPLAIRRSGAPSSIIRCRPRSTGLASVQGLVTHEQDVFAFAAERAAHAFGTAPHPLQSGEP